MEVRPTGLHARSCAGDVSEISTRNRRLFQGAGVRRGRRERALPAIRDLMQCSRRECVSMMRETKSEEVYLNNSLSRLEQHPHSLIILRMVPLESPSLPMPWTEK